MERLKKLLEKSVLKEATPVSAYVLIGKAMAEIGVIDDRRYGREDKNRLKKTFALLKSADEIMGNFTGVEI